MSSRAAEASGGPVGDPDFAAPPPEHAGRGVERAVLAGAVVGIAAGAVAWFAGEPAVAHGAWSAVTFVALLPLAWTVARDLRHGRMGVDVIALLAMGGALLLGESLAGAVIAVMLSGGQTLEAGADRRARRELRKLVERAPRAVHRYEDGALQTRALGAVVRGDRLLVKPGEVLPVDGVLESPAATLDESALTGEPYPVEHAAGDVLRSGTLNAGAPLDLRATTTAAESTYAGIVRLVAEAQSAKAPLVRLADRYAIVFLPLAVGIAGLAWALSGDPVRALAVLVVATPCPLILAAPVAITAGISRAARHGVLVKGGAALETLARGRVLLFDKTGTLTRGEPTVAEIATFGDLPGDEILRLAASLDLVSPHVLAAALVRAARERQIPLAFPTDVAEQLGSGIAGRVDGRTVALGKAEWLLGTDALPAAARAIRRRSLLEGSSTVFVAVDGHLAGALLLEDPLRADAARTLRRLRESGFERLVMVTGDHRDLAETVGQALGLDEVLAERSPAEKVEAVRAVAGQGVTVMVGDGINDAPALAAADVGVAMGARGATASSEAGDVVLLQDRIDGLVTAVEISRRTHRIALQSILAGMGLSVVGMGFAAVGWLPPVAGALAQEAIDVAVILNALRALGSGRRQKAAAPHERALGEQVRSEHRQFREQLRQMRELADHLDTLHPDTVHERLEEVRRFLVDMLAHDRHEDANVYPLVAQRMGGVDPTGVMSRAHLEIAHLVRLAVRLMSEIGPDGLSGDDVRELRRVLYGLDAVIRLHIAQEEESYLTLLDEQAHGVPAS